MAWVLCRQTLLSHMRSATSATCDARHCCPQRAPYISCSPAEAPGSVRAGVAAALLPRLTSWSGGRGCRLGRLSAEGAPAVRAAGDGGRAAALGGACPGPTEVLEYVQYSGTIPCRAQEMGCANAQAGMRPVGGGGSCGVRLIAAQRPHSSAAAPPTAVWRTSAIPPSNTPCILHIFLRPGAHNRRLGGVAGGLRARHPRKPR